jgi:hypothetical protein
VIIMGGSVASSARPFDRAMADERKTSPRRADHIRLVRILSVLPRGPPAGSLNSLATTHTRRAPVCGPVTQTAQATRTRRRELTMPVEPHATQPRRGEAKRSANYGLLIQILAFYRNRRLRLSRRWAVGIGAPIAVATLLWGMSQVGSPGAVAFASASSGAPAQCSAATLHGTYSFATESLQVSQPRAGPFAYAGFVTYDGNGHESEIYTISINGSVSRGITETATYTVSSDCVESEVDTGAGSIGTQHYDGYVSPDGSQMMYIQTDHGVVSAGTLIRVANSAIGR